VVESNGPALVTGATGFVGAAVARALLARGIAVRVFARPRSDRSNLQGLPVEVFEGDLTTARDGRRALAGCTTLYHVAARYTLWEAQPRELYRANVQATATLMHAALEAGIARVVYTSTVGAVGLPSDGSPGDERTPLPRSQLVGHYKRSKFLAERTVIAQVHRAGLPAVIVNPSTPMGIGDVKPTPTGKIIVDFLNGRMPAYIDTGLNVVDVGDVAIGHLLAAERGRTGERYILGNENISLANLLRLLAELSGLPAPQRAIPYGIALGAACAGELLALAARIPPPVPLAGVRMGRKKMYFSPAKAREELGLPVTPIKETLAGAIAWFARRGYVLDRHRAAMLLSRPEICSHPAASNVS
jgi:dihydroflavonol-4-reductase